MDCGFMLTHTPVMPDDSSWNTPAVLPSESMANVAASSFGMVRISKSGSRLRMSCTAFSMTVRLRSPRKSILRSPSSSSVVMVYCVTMVSSFVLSGT